MSLRELRHNTAVALEGCIWCLIDVKVTWWHTLFGHAVRCPNCGAYSGPPWTAKRLLVGTLLSFVLNGLILFAFARPLRALALLAFYVATVAALFAAAGSDGPLFLAAMLVCIFGPIATAIAEFIRHGVELARGPDLVEQPTPIAEEMPQAERPKFIGTARLEKIRNELEIAIYHHTEALRYSGYAAYVVTALAVGVGALGKQWLAVAVALILGGVAYTTSTHESRFFAAIYTLAAFALFFTHVTELSFAVGSFFAGGALLSITVRLARLRYIRGRIHLEPAEHLR